MTTTPANGERRLTRWLARRTLRARLIATLALLLTAAGLVIGLATTLALNDFLVNRLDQQLIAAGDRFTVSLEKNRALNDSSGAGQSTDPRGDGFGSAPGQAVGTLGVRVLLGQVAQSGVVTANGARPANLTAADQATLVAIPDDHRPRDIELSTLDEYRVLATPGLDGDVLLTGLPLQPVEDTLAQLITIELIVFAVVLAATVLGGVVLVRLSLRPLHRVTATARQVSDLPLATGEVALPASVLHTDPGTEVGQLGAAFDHMLTHIEDALTRRHAVEERLRQFAADASHELRTPLAVIRSNAEFLRRSPSPARSDVQAILSRIETASTRMGLLVDDLLLLARLDAGRPLAREPVDLTGLVIDTIADARAMATSHLWRLDLPTSTVTVPGDEHRLRQVLANLLTNARVHAPPGTTVTVRVRADESGTAQVSVTDDGPGIPLEVRTRLFERFVRGDPARSRVAGSTGLGLAIVSAIAHAHHGTVAVTSQPGDTTFLLCLPTYADVPGHAIDVGGLVHSGNRADHVDGGVPHGRGEIRKDEIGAAKL